MHYHGSVQVTFMRRWYTILEQVEKEKMVMCLEWFIRWGTDAWRWFRQLWVITLLNVYQEVLHVLVYTGTVHIYSCGIGDHTRDTLSFLSGEGYMLRIWQLTSTRMLHCRLDGETQFSNANSMLVIVVNVTWMVQSLYGTILRPAMLTRLVFLSTKKS